MTEAHPNQFKFEGVAQGPLWNATLRLTPGTVGEDLITALQEFQRVVRDPVIGYLVYEEDGYPYFHLTRYPEDRPDRPTPPDDAACNETASKLASWLGALQYVHSEPASPLMALICLKEGYEDDALTHDRDFARNLFDSGTELVDAHKISLRFKLGSDGDLLPYCNPEPAIIVRGTDSILPGVIAAAYTLGQHHIPIENYETGTITFFETSLAHPG